MSVGAAYTRAMRHWLLALNVGVAGLLAGALAAPLLAAAGAGPAAQALYAAYHFTCHQWAFRTFFLFGAEPVYSQADLAARGLDPFTFIGDTGLGWKMAFCERDLAIYVGLLAVGLAYARRRGFAPAGFGLYALLILPMALDGFTQLFGWRESTWQLRVITGLLFGLASAWLVLPRLDAEFGLGPAAAAATGSKAPPAVPGPAASPYPAEGEPAACDPRRPTSPLSPRSPAG